MLNIFKHIRIIDDALRLYLNDYLFAEIHVGDLEILFDNGEISFKKSKDRAIFLSRVNDSLKDLINSITKRPTVFVSDIPLLGNQYFGFMDRGTNIMEVRPLTGCINRCIFCSVSEGPGLQFWKRDFYVDWRSLVEFSKKISEIKGKENLEFLINPQGEIMLYEDLPDLVQGLKERAERVGIITTLWPLKEKLVLETIDSGLDFISLSLHSLDPMKSKFLLGNPEYDINKVIEFVKQINEKVDITITPVIIKRYNLKDLEDIIVFAKKNLKNKYRPLVAPQKYLVHKHGRKIRDEKFSWKEFFDYLHYLEKKYRIKLTFSNKDFKIEKRKEIPTPFRKGERVKVRIFSKGRRDNEYIVIAKNRSFSVYSDYENFDKVEVTYAKHNIIIGKAI